MDAGVDQHSAATDKIGLFRSLFRGREEVYAKRFESRRTGRAGYRPACAHEWVRGLCAKADSPRARCTTCTYLPVTDAVIHAHLAGKNDQGNPFVMGIYPMLLDETCFFLAIDFDKAHWERDVQEAWHTCQSLELPAAIEISRSGNGAHLWIFFATAVPAVLARQVGSHILTATMERQPEIGLDSYDRLFPNQDTLPKGGFGNLIALPLQKEARQHGRSVFVDPATLEPWPDQWAFLSSIEPLPLKQIESVAATARNQGSVIGVRLVPDDNHADSLPWVRSAPKRKPRSSGTPTQRTELTLCDQLYIPKSACSPPLRNAFLRCAAFQNPEFYQAQARRLPTFSIPRVIACAEDFPDHIALPRGCVEEAKQILADAGVAFHLNDKRQRGQAIDRSFKGTLRPDQQVAADALLAHESGVLSATTAFGKTVVGIWLIAQRSVNTLILVHRQQLLHQWIDRLTQFLDIPPKSIGQIGGGRRKVTGIIDIALIQSMARAVGRSASWPSAERKEKESIADILDQYGHVMVDECHHIPAFSMEQVVRKAKARFITGLSATVIRKDGHHPIITMQCGPIRHRVTAKQQARERPFTHVVRVRPTSAHEIDSDTENVRERFRDTYTYLIHDEARNAMIVSDVRHALEEQRFPLLLTERKEHLQILATLLESLPADIFILRGGMGKRAMQSTLDQLKAMPEDAPRVILATGRFIGEGFDDPRLDTLFLTLPVSWRGTIAQYAGRLHRLHADKREVRIYDYADLNIPLLARMFNRRCEGYEHIGYHILLPAHAVPGWPAEVPLPVDPEWKRDYASSIQRLIRDGVDASLADLFVRAATHPPAGKTGIDRARSASEAFLFRRLDSLPETQGRFQLNAEIPIPFNDRSMMEVDFLFAAERIVLEVDGAQHLADADAYRRDRRKDYLLQSNGYWVLRVLAEDVAQRLDALLDTLIGALMGRQAKRT